MRFGPYELIRPLGRGGMGETYMALRRGPGSVAHSVCVKRLISAAGDPTLARSFSDEARIIAQLRHANITQLIDYGTIEGESYLVLTLVDGLDLRETLSRLDRPLGPALAMYIGVELSRALDVAHRPGPGRAAPIIHRDISASNVLLSRAGEVVLTDFGIAKLLGEPVRTHSGLIRGKPAYMAPEYATRGEYSVASDLFALGVVLYECAAGKRPFDGDNELDTLRRIERGEHGRLDELCPESPPEFTELVESLLEGDPNARPRDAREVLRRLSPHAPAPTVSAEIGDLVVGLCANSGGQTQVDFEEVDRPIPFAPAQEPTRNLGVIKPYPAVSPSKPDANTHTMDGRRPDTEPAWTSTNPDRGYTAILSPSRGRLDTIKPSPSAKSRRIGLVFAGAFGFGLATVLAYVLVRLLGI